jgi:hypothetical protein
MELADWINQGIEAGFISADITCTTHDGPPVTEEEYENETCVFVARLLEV